MSQEVAPRADAVPATREEALPIHAILRAAQDPNTDVAKMEALVGLYERMQDRAAKQEYNAAMVLCQSDMPRVAKDGKVINHKTGALQSRYATLENLDSAIRPIYEVHGFAVTFRSGQPENGKYPIIATVRHRGGHSEDYMLPLALDQTGAKNDTQGMVSTTTYGRRALHCMIWNIITEGTDNDGASAGDYERITPEQADTINTMLADVGGNRAKFLAWLKVEKLEDIPAARYGEVIVTLKKKVAR